MRDTLDAFSENIGRIVRNILPGFLILIAAQAAHQSWFDWVDFGNLSHLLVLALIAIVAGNTWLSFHRYGLHQFIDILFYIDGKEGPVKGWTARKDSTELSTKQEPDSERDSSTASRFSYELYVHELAKYVVDNLRRIPDDDPVRNHVDLRAAGMHLMYIASEICFIFSFSHEPGSFFARHAIEMRILGLIGLDLTLFQNWITRRIDWYSFENYPVGKQSTEKEATEQTSDQVMLIFQKQGKMPTKRGESEKDKK